MLAGCAQPEWQAFDARSGSYRFPAKQVRSVTTAPHRFIRVSPRGEPFDLVFDTRIDGHVDHRGHPQIFSIDRALLVGATYERSPAGIVVCRTGIASVDCGLSLLVNGDRWSLLFPAGRKSDAGRMADRAARFLSAHAVEPPGKRPPVAQRPTLRPPARPVRRSAEAGPRRARSARPGIRARGRSPCRSCRRR